MIGDGTLQLTDLSPGLQAWLAVTNSNFLGVNNEQPYIRVWKSGTALAVNDALAFDPTTGKLVKADSNGAACLFNMIGFALNAAGGVDVDIRVRVLGIVSYTHAFTPGSVVYLSETPGLLTQTAPTTPRVVALALPSNKLFINPLGSWRAT